MAFNRHKVMQTAQKYLRQGKVENAIGQLLQILQENPDDANTINQVGDLYARIGKKGEAFNYYSQLAERYANDGFNLKAIAIYKKITKIDPSQLEINVKLGELYVQQGLKNEAKSQFIVVSDYHIQKNERLKAVEALRKILELEPDNIKFRAKLADLLTKEGLTEQSIGEYSLIADALIARGMQDEAFKVLKKAQKLRINHPGIAASLGRLYLSKGDSSKAASTVGKAMGESPEDPKLLRVSAEINLADGNEAEAKNKLEALSKFAPDDTLVGRKLEELQAAAAPPPAPAQQSEGEGGALGGVDLTMEDIDHVSGEWAAADLARAPGAVQVPGGVEEGVPSIPGGFDFMVPAGQEVGRDEREDFINEHLTEAE
ncbi:tetratricopeptide repeat protein, partial [Acidobacteriota bacterium]